MSAIRASVGSIVVVGAGAVVGGEVSGAFDVVATVGSGSVVASVAGDVAGVVVGSAASSSEQAATVSVAVSDTATTISDRIGSTVIGRNMAPRTWVI